MASAIPQYFTAIPRASAKGIHEDDADVLPWEIWDRPYIPAHDTPPQAVRAFNDHWNIYYKADSGPPPHVDTFLLKDIPSWCTVRPQSSGYHIAIDRSGKKNKKVRAGHFVLCDVDGDPLDELEPYE